jgi:uncharacterized protein YxeA
MNDRDNPPKPPKNEIHPVAAILIIVVCVGGFIIFLMENAVKTPLVRSFDDAARQSKIATCESEKGYKNTEDCYK